MARLGAALSGLEKTVVVHSLAISAIRLLIFTGCRRGEILGLRWREVDFDSGRLHFSDSKTGPRTVVLNAPALEVLSNLSRNSSEFVFPSGNTGAHIVDLRRPWEKVRSKAGLLDLRLHDLRHTFASVAVNSGESLYLTGHLLGHATARTTERYAHLADDPLKSASERIGGRIDAMMKGKSAKIVGSITGINEGS